MPYKRKYGVSKYRPNYHRGYTKRRYTSYNKKYKKPVYKRSFKKSYRKRYVKK